MEPITTYPEAAVAYTKMAKVTQQYLQSINGPTRPSSQFTIDLIETHEQNLDYLLEELSTKTSREQFFALETEFGARCYELGTLLEIIDQSLPDVQILKDILAVYKKADDIKYVGLL